MTPSRWKALALTGWLVVGALAHALMTAHERASEAEAETVTRQTSLDECLGRNTAATERLTANYLAWLARLAPLYDQTHPVEMVPVRVTETQPEGDMD